ncbi:MAG: SUMF1/EgtB/PvdO family nonheme iron enzyme [Candidatus Aminicenantes bacterium]|nr:SUMF1/EgtB/PvdO family nonheme iron enzyme [Candidatus Aminicenantes bacterium]
MKRSKGSLAVILVFVLAASNVFGFGSADSRLGLQSERPTASPGKRASPPQAKRDFADRSDAFAPVAIGGKTKAEAVIQKKKFPWLLVGGLAVVGVVAAVLIFKKKKNPNPAAGPIGPTGNIQIESTPTGAKVYRGGADTGLKTNTTLHGVPVGAQTIKLALDGYKDYEQSVDVQEGQTAEIKATLILNSILEPVLVRIPGGTFLMGSDSEEALPEEKPVHQVTVSGFQIGKFEVTQEQWFSVMGTNPSVFRGDRLPVDNLQWDDCQAYIEKLNAATGKRYRLPTEAEWEFACRAGTTGDRYGELNSIAWYNGNSGGTTHDVGGKQPNGYGLYDMLGNAFEWCWDWYGDYTADTQINPKGPDTPTPGTPHHILRGGSWLLEAVAARAPFRSLHVPAHKADVLGFRVAMD